MNVTQCDVCKNVVKHEQSAYVRVFSVTKNDECGNVLVEADLCPACKERVLKLLGKGSEKNVS